MKPQEQPTTDKCLSWHDTYLIERATAILRDQIEAEKSGSTDSPVVQQRNNEYETNNNHTSKTHIHY